MNIDISKKYVRSIIYIVMIAVAAWMILAPRYESNIPSFLPYILLFFTVSLLTIATFTLNHLFNRPRQGDSGQPNAETNKSVQLTDYPLSLKAWSITVIVYIFVGSLTTIFRPTSGIIKEQPPLSWGDIIIRYPVPLVLFLATWLMTKNQRQRRYLRPYLLVLWGIGGLAVLFFIAGLIFAVS